MPDAIGIDDYLQGKKPEELLDPEVFEPYGINGPPLPEPPSKEVGAYEDRYDNRRVLSHDEPARRRRRRPAAPRAPRKPNAPKTTRKTKATLEQEARQAQADAEQARV